MQVAPASCRSPDAATNEDFAAATASVAVNVSALHINACDLGHPGNPSSAIAILREQAETTSVARRRSSTDCETSSDPVLMGSAGRVARHTPTQRPSCAISGTRLEPVAEAAGDESLRTGAISGPRHSARPAARARSSLMGLY